MSHHATEDIAILRALPDVAVFTPGDPMETEACVQAVYHHQGVCYLRLGRGGERKVHTEAIKNYLPGTAIVLEEGRDAYLFSAGGILAEARKAVDELFLKGISCGLVSFPTVKPIDSAMITEIASKVDAIFTLEEHNIVGGFGSAVSEVVASLQDRRAVVERIGLNDTYSSTVGSQEYLRDYYGMSAEKIVERIHDCIASNVMLSPV
jgi:transketolase